MGDCGPGRLVSVEYRSAIEARLVAPSDARVTPREAGRSPLFSQDKLS